MNFLALVVRWPERLLIFVIRAYRLLLKPWIGNACRFEPTCSAYALLAIQRHGALRGTTLGALRVLRCHPGCAGGCDPVPTDFTMPGQRLFSRLGLRPDPVPEAPIPRKTP